MKTPEEIVMKIYDGVTELGTLKEDIAFIREVQLDAQRAAYAECAEIAKRIGAAAIASHILTARDNLKLP